MFSCAEEKDSSTENVKLSTDTIQNVDSVPKKVSKSIELSSSVMHPKGYKNVSTFYDTTINNIRLNDCDTIIKLFGDKYKLSDNMPEFPNIQIINSNQSQLLTMYMMYGSSKCDFSQFQIEYAPNSREKLLKSFKLDLINFISGKGIHLGMSVSQLKLKLGEPSETKQAKRQTILSYQEYNGLYFADYYFKKDRLIKFRYGYEYP